MPVSDMVDELNGYIDHNPDLATYRNRVIGELDAAHMEFCTSNQWLFLQATTIFSTLAPVEGSSTATALVTNGAYAVILTGASPSTDWEGHMFFGPDGREYEIARYTNIGGSDYLFLMTRYLGDTDAASTTWSVRFLQYALPVDCQEVLSLFDLRTKMRMPFISRGRDEMLAFNRLGSGGPLLTVDTVMRTDRPPDYAPTLALSVGGTLDASSTYEVCYTFTLAGRESPKSKTASITTTALNKTINVSGMEDTRDTTDRTGIFKKVYYRNATRKGRWLCANPAVADQVVENGTTYTLDAETTNRRESNELFGSEPFRQYVRFDPPAGDERFVEVRYKKKVRKLASDSDMPQVPVEYERIIVLRAVRRMCLSIGADRLYSVWKAEADELERNCKAVWLTRSNLTEQRQGIRMPGTGGIDPRLLGTYRMIS